MGLGTPLPGHNCHHLGRMLDESLSPVIENTIFWRPQKAKINKRLLCDRFW